MDEKTIEKVKVRAMSSLLHRNVLGALGMLLPVFSIIAGFFGLNYPKWLTMVVEAALLLLFGFAWLVKGKLFKFN